MLFPGEGLSSLAVRGEPCHQASVFPKETGPKRSDIYEHEVCMEVNKQRSGVDKESNHGIQIVHAGATARNGSEGLPLQHKLDRDLYRSADMYPVPDKTHYEKRWRAAVCWLRLGSEPDLSPRCNVDRHGVTRHSPSFPYFWITVS